MIPQIYNLFASTLLDKNSEIPATVAYDAFRWIYECFHGNFARTHSNGSDFYTSVSIVHLIVEILEPYHGRVLDPACDSGGMFVHPARFVAEHKKEPTAQNSPFTASSTRTDGTGRLCRMNLAVHLEGDIRHGATSTATTMSPSGSTTPSSIRRSNVNAVDKKRLKDMMGTNRPFPFGPLRSDSTNYLWAQFFYSALRVSAGQTTRDAPGW